MKTLLEAIQSGEVEVSVGIDFYCVVPRHDYDLGAVTLRRGDKSLILDVCQSYTDEENHHTYITCDLEYDEDLISEMDTNSDLKLVDVYSLDEATLYIGGDFEVEPESVTLFVKSNGSTRAIDLQME